MAAFIHLLLAFCALHQFINSSVEATGPPWRAADRRGAERRTVRSVNRPTPIDCRLGNWSPWTPCNSCTDKKFRFRYLEKPSQFGGTQCFEMLWEAQACPTATTQCIVPDYCEDSFTCKSTGRCISHTLRCNGEPDCEDFSDEDDCANFNLRDDKCSRLMPIPGAEKATQGYNILTGDLVDRVLDPSYYGGMCEYVYNGDWRKFTYDSFCENLHYNEDDKNYRKPYNFHTYRFVAQASSEGSHEYYEDVASLLNARKTMKSFNGGVTVGIYYVQGGISGSKESEFVSNITRFKSQALGFVRLWSKVQTAQFKMRSNNLMLHDDLYVSLMELPEQYDFGMYSRFLNMFGTHYVTEGTMGGTLEYVVVINKASMSESKLESKEVGRCIGGSIGLSNPLGAYGQVDLMVGGNKCKKKGTGSQAGDSSSVMVEDIVTLVHGGIIDKSSSLLVIRNPQTYRKWGASLKYNPALIEYETRPIYELVRRSTAAGHLGARLANLQRAWDEYMHQFDPCRCAPCRHNGIPALKGTSCECICKSGFQGDACEETLRRDAKTDGSWSCWGSWSSCSSGRRTRSRTCDNPPPDGGGASCPGSSSQTRQC